ncbi:ATP-binding cassette domain-containing protein [Effusibacillus lacus]|uniref:ABC transporter n=1 Tax=Effusibacillus lacus TaxID=1348429 RepID=A0A292YLN4_9BACL|nr:ATP-binding cassette domain-containing protein [Effusibacillus lacus]TCS67843.1 molybdate transport system ATP-binding protein [Effusibacillus lacus]GAX89819.1 ABC transporter [Effusibacillus lacus]
MLDVQISKRLPDFTLDAEFSADGTVQVIVGPSGSGKTTLLECIAGIQTPDTGEIRLGNRTLFSKATNVNVPVNKRKIGFVFQEYALFPHLSVKRNLLFARGILRSPDAPTRSLLQRTAERLGIVPLMDRMPQELSGGEQQRVALGRALVMEPELLLLDEPFSALDSGTLHKVLPLVQEVIAELNIPTLLITHQEEVAKAFGSRILRMEHGKLTHCRIQ